MKKWRRMLGVFLSLVFSIFIIRPALAENSTITISPNLDKFEFETNEEIKRELKIKNGNEENSTIVVFAAPYNIKNENYDIDFSADSAEPSSEICASIIFKDVDNKYKNQLSLELNPNEEKTIKYKINFENSINSEQRCAIFAQKTIEKTIEKTLDQNSETRTYRVVSLVLASPKNSESKTEIKNQTSPSGFYNGDLYSELSLENTGKKHSEIETTFRVKSLFNKTLYEVSNKNLIFPEKPRTINLKWDKSPNFGLYKLETTVSIGGETAENTSIVFLLPFPPELLPIFLLTFIIFMLIIKTVNKKSVDTLRK